jgi:hypothetical protein
VRDVFLVREARLAEMHLVVDGAGQQVPALAVQFAHALRLADAFLGHALNASSAQQHVRLGDGAFVHHLHIADQPVVHVRSACRPGLMEMRIFNTPTKASLKILELILLLPFTRSLKVMGTSAIFSPACFTRYFISIWKA